MPRYERHEIEAIEKSITHWENMRKDIDCGESPCGAECAMCSEFGTCSYCPLAEVSGPCDREAGDGHENPWHEANQAFNKENIREFYELADKMLECLRKALRYAEEYGVTI